MEPKQNSSVGTSKKGVRLPKTHVLNAGSPKSRAQQIFAIGLEEFVIKPTISATAYGTFRLRAEDQTAVIAALSTLPESMPLLLQEFIPEILTAGELSFIFFNGIFSHAVRKVPKHGDFRVQEDFGGRHEAFLASQKLCDEAAEILKVSGGRDWLYARVDVVLHKGRPYLMELEAIDPMLYFAYASGAVERFARAIADRV